MPTRWLLDGLFAFSVATLLGFVLALAGPVAPIRLLGAITALLSVSGVIVHAQLIQDTDPHAWSVIRYRGAELPALIRARVASLRLVFRPHAS